MYGRAWAQLEQKHLEPAIKSFRDVLEAWPDSPLAPAATFALARTLVDLKRYEEALPLLSAFGTKYPKSPQEPEAQYLLGWTRLTAGQPAEASQTTPSRWPRRRRRTTSCEPTPTSCSGRPRLS